MISIDRLPRSSEDGLYCPLRRHRVVLDDCRKCRFLVKIDSMTPPRFVVCRSPYTLSWLGLDIDT